MYMHSGRRQPLLLVPMIENLCPSSTLSYSKTAFVNLIRPFTILSLQIKLNNFNHTITTNNGFAYGFISAMKSAIRFTIVQAGKFPFFAGIAMTVILTLAVVMVVLVIVVVNSYSI